jgi:7,8-dihydro-6-hydroxymethylpterin dimethyltransferase
MEKIYNRTRSLCPACGQKVDAFILEKEGAVFLEKQCPQHGVSCALISSDASWYRDSLHFVKPRKQPRALGADTFTSCPESCGLCPEHGQHTCLPVIEITSSCDLNCQICLKQWKNQQEMSVQEFSGVLDTLLVCEGFVPVINLSGGEPTMHPQIIDMVEIAKRKGVMQTSISTNGLRLLRDADFRHKLSALNPLIALQFDGFKPYTSLYLRGRDIVKEKLSLIEILEKELFNYSLVATVAEGVNDEEITAITDFFFKSKAVSLMFQPMAFTGKASLFRDPLHRLTIPDVIAKIEKCTCVKKGDFVPLPCSHPTCFALSYYFQADAGNFVSVKDLLGLEKYLEVIANRTLPGLDIEGFNALRDRVYDLWSAADQFPHSGMILKKIRNILKELSENGFRADKAFEIGIKSVKAIFIHQFMDRDTLDFGRLIKCCNHYPQADGRLIPMCAQNVFFS